MMTRIVKWLAIFAIAGVFGWVQFLNFTGYCYSQRRYLSDAELIRSAIEYSLAYDRRVEISYEKRYLTPEDLLARSTDCCLLRRDGHGDFVEGPWVRALGWYIVFVDLWYKIKQTPPNNYRVFNISMNSCADIKETFSSFQSLPPK